MFYDWHHLPSSWQQDNTESDLGEKKEVGGTWTPLYSKIKHAFCQLFFKIISKLQTVETWKQGLLERNGSFSQITQGALRKGGA